MNGSIGRWLKLSGLALAVYGCTAPPIPRPTETTSQKYDAVTLFRGVYFQDGPAKKIVDTWKVPRRDAADPKAKAPRPEVAAANMRGVAKSARAYGLRFTAGALESLANDVEAGKIPTHEATSQQKIARQKLIVAAIKKQDPKFFTRFARRMTSGNHLYVMKALKEGEARIASAAVGIAMPVKARVVDEDGGGDGGSDDFSNDSQSDGASSEPSDDSNFSQDDSQAFNNDDSTSNNNNQDDSTSNNNQDDSTSNNNQDDSTSNNQDGAGNDPKSGSGEEDKPVGDQASLVWSNYAAVHDTGVFYDKVAVVMAGPFFSQNDDKGGTQTASFVDHVVTSLGGGK